jgi:hypothetical protein
LGTEVLTVDGAAEVILRLLADMQGKPPAEVRATLERAGPQLPVDSLLIVEILARVEEICGCRIPADVPAARSMGSVYSFAQTVVAAIPATGVGSRV